MHLAGYPRHEEASISPNHNVPRYVFEFHFFIQVKITKLKNLCDIYSLSWNGQTKLHISAGFNYIRTASICACIPIVKSEQGKHRVQFI